MGSDPVNHNTRHWKNYPDRLVGMACAMLVNRDILSQKQIFEWKKCEIV